MRIVITGGAGFIGTHLSRRLLVDGHDVVVFDSFSPQIHGLNATLASDLTGHVHLMRGDVRDREALCGALLGADAVVHLAAETGTGQSMYDVAHYADVNIQGTSVLMDLLINERRLDVQKIVVASSRAIYGEGRYLCGEHGIVYPGVRSKEAMLNLQFEPECPICKTPCVSQKTKEDSRFSPSSFYGLTKQVQEQTVLMMAQAIGVNAIALRYQNVYGAGQSLQNPYTGILAIFSNLARVGKPIRIFEDGLESRDFVYVSDVVEATTLALCDRVSGNLALNVGTGVGTSVLEVAQKIVEYYGGKSDISVTGEFRIGDIRHNTADLTNIYNILGYTPLVSFSNGVINFLEWASGEDCVESGYEKSLAELRQRGLMNG